MKKLSTSLILSFAALSVMAEDQVKLQYFTQTAYQAGWMTNVSTNKRYVLGGNAGSVFLYDRKDGTMKHILGPTINGSVTACNGNDVTDDGVVVGIATNADLNIEGTYYYSPSYYINGEWYNVNWLEGAQINGNLESGPGWDGSVNACTNNGAYMTGNASTSIMYVYAPVIWSQLGEIVQVLPTNGAGGAGANVLSMSDNAKVLGGWTVDSAYGNATVWSDGEIQTYGQGVISFVSNNGKYAVGYTSFEDTDWKEQPVLWTKEAGFVRYDGLPDDGGSVFTAISEDGKCIIGYSYFGLDRTDRKAFIYVDGVINYLDNYVKDTYNLELEYPLFTPIAISGDAKVIAGFSNDGGLRIPWLLELEDYSTSVANAVVKPVEVTFDSESSLASISGNWVKAEVYSQMGVKMAEFNESSLDMSNFATGVYFIKVSSEGKVQTEKVFKK